MTKPEREIVVEQAEDLAEEARMDAAEVEAEAREAEAAAKQDVEQDGGDAEGRASEPQAEPAAGKSGKAGRVGRSRKAAKAVEGAEGAEDAEAGDEADAAAPAEAAADAKGEGVPADGAEAEAGEAAAEGAAESADEAIAQAKAQAAEWQGKYLRLHAEWDTYRRRKTEEAAAEKERATEKLVGELIPVIDDFERTIDYANKNGEEGLLGGVEAVLKKFLDVLQRSGVQIIDPAGEAYNALEAQAVATVPDESVPEETVADVYQKGYKMGTKVLRSAMVTVTTGGPAREKPAEGEDEQ